MVAGETIYTYNCNPYARYPKYTTMTDAPQSKPMTGRQNLERIAALLKQGQYSPSVTVRTLLSWFDAQRRSYWNVFFIRRALKDNNLETAPDFESAYIDSYVKFTITTAAQKTLPKANLAQTDSVTTEAASPLSIYADPTYRISKLAAANKQPTTDSPDPTLQHAATVMLANDFSQLPVMTNERDVKGVLSWTSIRSRLALGRTSDVVRELMDDSHEIRADASLFQAIPIIVEHQYVLVRGSDNKISGIVTATDLSLQFGRLAEPFLLLGEIENHIRRILGEKFSADELKMVGDPTDKDRKIEDVADLTFGEYIRLLENEAR
jgi:CBS domain-containing protein